MFTKSRLILSAWYTCILLLILVAFSTALFVTYNNDVSRIVLKQDFGDRVPKALSKNELRLIVVQVRELRQRALLDLVVIDVVTLLIGAGLSYFLAGKTLQPIKKSMDSQELFIADASHELRNPITTIQSACEVVLRSPDKTKEDYKKVVEQVLDQSQRLGRLVNDLLSLSVLDAQNPNKTLTTCSLTSLVEKELEAMMPLFKKSKLNLEKSLVPNVSVNGDADKIQQLIVILLDNAIKFTPHGGRITVKVLNKPQPQLIVTDSGVGIKTEHHDAIFGRFYQTDTAHTVSGAGLGLAIAQSIMNLHNGTITVKSKIGNGSTFICAFPKVKKCMFLKSFVIIIGISLGVLVSLFLTHKLTLAQFYKTDQPSTTPQTPNKEVIGFLEYALLPKAKLDYSKEITTLSYFGFTLDTDGTIVKMANPTEEDPGWYAFESGKVDPFLESAKQHNVTLSLVVFSGDNDVIDTVMEDPINHATALSDEVIPIMNTSGFRNLNLDIEHPKDASKAAQTHFIQFTQTLKNNLAKSGKSLTVDVSTLDLINSRALIQPKEIGNIADTIVIMAYDYHSTASRVTGPVAPLGGAGIESEYDVEAAVENALPLIPSKKIILGAPLYGYEWETIGEVPRSAIISNTGATASNRRAEEFVSGCATCSAQFDQTAKEAYVSYKDFDTGLYHQMFYPTKESMSEKITLAENNDLRGIALWALGYEGNTIMEPLQQYLQ